jgi:two-component system, chemotaxis family, CheB/CheR fusion protein
MTAGLMTRAAAGRRQDRPAGKLPLRELTEQALLQQVVQAGALVNAGRHPLSPRPHRHVPGTRPRRERRQQHPEDGPGRLAARPDHGPAQGRANQRNRALPGPARQTNGDFTTVNLTVRPWLPLPPTGREPPLYLVILEQAGARTDRRLRHPAGRIKRPARRAAPMPKPASPLKQELRAKEEYLQTTNEELETSNEELKSSNEEMQSVNEELQSTNEELETSKEELQSVNEELATVNAELQTKVATCRGPTTT